MELVYDDKEETAAGKVPYRVEFSDGSQKSGVLNAKGWACLEDCPNGEATVIFGDEAERQSAEQRLPDLYRQLAASLDTAAAEMAKKSEQLAAQADVQQISDSFRQKVDAQLAELTAQREQFNQQQIWQQALQTGQDYTQGLSQGTASFMDDLLDFSGLMAFLEEAEISLSLLLEAIMTGDVDALEAKLAQWRARGENGLKATGEAMEMLILLLKDEYVRALLQSLPLRYLDALPKDKLAEIAGYMHSRVSLDGMLEMSLVLLAALVGSVFGVILMFLVVTKKRASRIISPASSVLEDIAKAQKAVRNDHAVQTYIGKHQTPLNSKTPKGDVDTPQKSRKNADKDVPNRQVLTKAERLNIQKALQTRVEDIRAELPKKLQGSGNVGVAQLDIPGLPIELKAHSRINYPTDKGADGFVHLADESDWIFKPKAVDPDNVRVGTPDAYTRQWDTEFKILNDVALRLGNNRNATGSINLFTERLTCTSCTDVIFDFKARYPNIQLNVFAGE
ncbi:deaminase domain-containing protein [Shewanella algae]|uniref:deaminase domain-containing protein n=1 Tax=Shewanella algae TaxID=38313 RepID=UPI001C578B9C|nr:deaminase domain-containing protein [Shewanella algae]